MKKIAGCHSNRRNSNSAKASRTIIKKNKKMKRNKEKKNKRKNTRGPCERGAKEPKQTRQSEFSSESQIGAALPEDLRQAF